MLYRDASQKLQPQAGVQAPAPLGVADVLGFINLAKWPVAICALLFGILALFYTLSVQPLYTAASTIFLQNQKGLVISKEANGSIPMDVGEIETQMEIMRSERVADEVIHTTDLDKFLPPTESSDSESTLRLITNTISRWVGPTAQGSPEQASSENPRDKLKRKLAREGLTVYRPGLSYTVEIGYTASDPELAAILANAYAKAYITERRNQRRDTIREATAWMEERVSQLRVQAEEAFTAAEEYREANIGMRPGLGSGQPTETADQRRIKLKRLENAAQTLQSTYETFFERLAEITQQQSAPGSDALILNQATIPTSQSFPKKKVTILLALVAGAGIGAAGALLRRLLSKSIESPAQLRSVGIPYLGSLPVVSSAWTKGRQVSAPPPPNLRRPSAEESSRLIVAEASRLHKAVLSHPDNPFSEAIRNLKVELELAGLGEGIHTLGVLTTTAGKTGPAIVSNLASLLALQESTLLIDADVDHPQLSQALVPSSDLGLAGVVSGKAKLEQALALDRETGLRVLPREQAKDHPEITLAVASPQKLNELFGAARAHAEIVIVNLAPVDCTATKSIIPHLDAILILADQRRTGLSELTELVTELGTRGSNVIGVALYGGDRRRKRIGKG